MRAYACIYIHYVFAQKCYGVVSKYTLFPGDLDCTQRWDAEYPWVAGKDGHGVEPLSCKEETRLGHLDTAVVAVLAVVEEHPEIQGSGEEVSDVRLCHRIRTEEEYLVGVLDVRDGLRSELSSGPDTRANYHETSALLEDNGLLKLLLGNEIT